MAGLRHGGPRRGKLSAPRLWIKAAWPSYHLLWSVPRQWVVPESAFTSSLKHKLRVLDFVKSGGPFFTVDRTVFELWLGPPDGHFAL